jgi:hypothetical protein
VRAAQRRRIGDRPPAAAATAHEGGEQHGQRDQRGG